MSEPGWSMLADIPNLTCDCRSMLLMALLTCLNHVFLVENPGSSMIGAYPRFQWLIDVLKEQGIAATCPDLLLDSLWDLRESILLQ